MRSLHPSATADGTDPIQVRPLTLETKRLDTDNLIKPIQDVLKTLVYHDDVQIVDAVFEKDSTGYSTASTRNFGYTRSGVHRGKGICIH